MQMNQTEDTKGQSPYITPPPATATSGHRIFPYAELKYGHTVPDWILEKQTNELYDDIAADSLETILTMKKDLEISTPEILHFLDDLEIINSTFSDMFSEIFWSWYCEEWDWDEFKADSDADEEIDHARRAVTALHYDFGVPLRRIMNLISEVECIYKYLSADGRVRIGAYMREVAKYDVAEISRMIEATKTAEGSLTCAMAA